MSHYHIKQFNNKITKIIIQLNNNQNNHNNKDQDKFLRNKEKYKHFKK